MPMATRASPAHQRRDRDDRRQPLPADERERQATADDDTQSERGVQDPGTRLADVEDLQREEDEQDVEGADDHHPQRQDGNDDPGASVAGDQAQPVEEAAPIRRVGSSRLVHVRHRLPAEGRRTTSVAARRDAIVAAPKTVVGVATARMAAATSGPTSMPAPSIVPDRPFAAVSSSGVRDRLGMSEPWCRTGDRQRGRCARRGQDDHEGRGTERHPEPRRAVGRHLRQVAQEQEPVTGDAVPEPGDERRQHGARDQLDDRHETDARRPDGLVGVQEDRDPRPEFDGVEEEEGELHAPKRRVAQDRPDHPE